jgi:hypothetical protein
MGLVASQFFLILVLKVEGKSTKELKKEKKMKNLESVKNLVIILTMFERTAPGFKSMVRDLIKDCHGISLNKESLNELLSLQFDGVNDVKLVQNFLTK